MAEGLAVAAIVSSIVQLVDFTSKVLSRLNEFHSNTKEIPKSLEYLTTELPVIVRTLEGINEAIDDGRFSAKSATALLPAVQGCEKCIADINSVLSDTLPKSSDGRARKAVKSVVSVLNDGKIDSITKTLRGYVTTLTFYLVASSSSSTSLTAEKLVRIREWLAAPDPSTNYHKAISLRLKSTGSWFLESDVYTKWKETPSFIWLHGIPGCGKTILSSTILENTLEHTKDDPGVAVAYFFFDFNDRDKQDVDLMIRSLILQLMQQCIHIPPCVMDVFSACNDGLQKPSEDILLQVLRHLLASFPSSYIIMDALDECDDRRVLLRVIKEICAWDIPGIRILFTSRREGDIEAALEKVVENDHILPIKAESVDPDIHSYICHRMLHEEELQKWHSNIAIRDQIETSLTKGARGMFRWAVCQLDLLRDCRNRKQVLQALSNLPKTLDETYNRVLCAIKSSDMPYAIRIFRWLVCSTRPLSLPEAAEVAAMDPDRDLIFDVDEVLEEPKDVLSICSSLVTMDAGQAPWEKAGLTFKILPKSPVISLAHYSVQEYLLSNRILESSASIYAMNLPLSHSCVSRSCLRYLIQLFQLQEENGQSEFALAEYAAKYWSVHAFGNLQHDQEMVDLVTRLLGSEDAYLFWKSHLHADDSSISSCSVSNFALFLSPVTIATNLGMSEVVDRLISDYKFGLDRKSSTTMNWLLDIDVSQQSTLLQRVFRRFQLEHMPAEDQPNITPYSNEMQSERLLHQIRQRHRRPKLKTALHSSVQLPNEK